ncbi:Uncharacterised protein [Vibrio cholerae]|uniref:Uncharacterized protein n=1 Tax=Vibrio cholerae TaxID=666 RepID=A0A655R3Y5_VIBCL|nr:Uncharacterised protein [Vibrio cholerae]CSA69724.1 Uncharacterised protein [Vibrio cholerae]CSA83465.1 Uncharacterised protein [Vibrio cholerae]CSB34876.1 Uncharacterised protein [Vibrio cholerae]CSB60815.1 Uncharacterised protein [Vibrio cholerae]
MRGLHDFFIPLLQLIQHVVELLRKLSEFMFVIKPNLTNTLVFTKLHHFHYTVNALDRTKQIARATVHKQA